MTKKDAALLLGSATLALLLSISYTKAWLSTMDIPTGGSCLLSAEAQKEPTARRVCLDGSCILYSDWIKMSDEERASIQRG